MRPFENVHHLPPRRLLNFRRLRILFALSPDVHPADRFFALHALLHQSLLLLLRHLRSSLLIFLRDYSTTFLQVLVFPLHHDLRAARFRGGQALRRSALLSQPVDLQNSFLRDYFITEMLIFCCSRDADCNRRIAHIPSRRYDSTQTCFYLLLIASIQMSQPTVDRSITNRRSVNYISIHGKFRVAAIAWPHSLQCSSQHDRISLLVFTGKCHSADNRKILRRNGEIELEPRFMDDSHRWISLDFSNAHERKFVYTYTGRTNVYTC